MRIAVVEAARDVDALVRCVEHSDIEGLPVEADTFDVFCENIAATVDGESDGAETPIEIIARASLRARVRA